MSLILSKKIIAWYQKHQRDLPWRKYKNSVDKDFKVLLSEIMLQQTKVSTVIPYFNKFYKKFSSIESLSKSRITSVLKLWEGLGYYRRARNLHQTAKIIVKKHNGILPDSFLHLKSLPGIGDYTASAILAIAKDKSYIGIDGNVKRVISRIFNLYQGKNFLFNLEQKLKTMQVNVGSSDLMQGIMEIGALLCLPKDPKCKLCPLKNNCISNKKNTFNKVSTKKYIKERNFYAFYLKKNNRILFTYNKNFNFLDQLINLPIIESDSKNYKLPSKKVFKKAILKDSSISKLRYKISNFIMVTKVLELKDAKINKDNFFWIHKDDISKFTISVLAKKLLKLKGINIK